MTKTASTDGLPAIHPGAFLREDILPYHDKTKVEIAAALGTTRAELDNILKEKRAISPAMALKLARLFPPATAETWLRLQAAYDLKVTRDELAAVLEAMPSWKPDKKAA